MLQYYFTGQYRSLLFLNGIIISTIQKVGEECDGTDSLLQNTLTLARDEIFWDPTTNATYATTLNCELEKCGHYVHLAIINR